MVSGINNFSGAQTLRALNAFKADDFTVKKGRSEENQTLQKTEVEQEPKETPLREEISKKKAEEVKKYGQLFDMQISNNDINYALTYGRSIIVDYNA